MQVLFSCEILILGHIYATILTVRVEWVVALVFRHR